VIITKGVHVAVRVRYSEPNFNQQNKSIVRGVLRDWSRGIHSVNKVPKLNFPHCTNYNKIGHQINECPFIKNNMRQRFAKHFQNLNLEPTRTKNHGYIKLEDLYHDRVRIPNRLREHI
jgi:hypothetical protein